jgi:hypothetical protein
MWKNLHMSLIATVATPTIVNNATAAQITEANRAHKEDTCLYRTYTNVDQAFNKLIKLTAQLEASQAYNKNLKDDIVDLQMKMQPTKTTNNDTYCWSHGYQVDNEHTSAMCKNPKEGHKKWSVLASR